VQYVNDKNIVPRTAEVLQRQVAQYQMLSYAMKWTQPRNFTLHHVNSPAVLLHWRVLLSLICLITESQRKEWRKLGQGYTAPSLSEDSEEEERSEKAKTSQSQGAMPVKTTTRVELLPAYDSHFHYDRLKMKLRKDIPVKEILTLNIQPEPKVQVHLLGALMIFCDPHTYSDVIQGDSEFPAAVASETRCGFQFKNQAKG